MERKSLFGHDKDVLNVPIGYKVVSNPIFQSFLIYKRSNNLHNIPSKEPPIADLPCHHLIKLPLPSLNIPRPDPLLLLPLGHKAFPLAKRLHHIQLHPHTRQWGPVIHQLPNLQGGAKRTHQEQAQCERPREHLLRQGHLCHLQIQVLLTAYGLSTAPVQVVDVEELATVL